MYINNDIIVEVYEDDSGESEEEYDDEQDPGDDQLETEEAEEQVTVTRIVTTVPAKEPRMDAQPLKPALKKPRSQQGAGSSRNREDKSSSSRYDICLIIFNLSL